MGYIKGPEHTELTVINREMTPDERAALSKVIRTEKEGSRERLMIEVTAEQKVTLLQLFELLDVPVVSE